MPDLAMPIMFSKESFACSPGMTDIAHLTFCSRAFGISLISLLLDASVDDITNLHLYHGNMIIFCQYAITRLCYPNM